MTRPSFAECVWACWDNPDFMREYRRLSGDSLGLDKRPAIVKMVDAATGYQPPALDEQEALRFLDFVRDVVWSRLPPSGAAS